MSSRPSNHHFGSSGSASSAQSGSDSDSSSSSSGHRHSMDSIALPIASVEVLRCMRCARSVETTSTDDVTTMGMTNWYTLATPKQIRDNDGHDNARHSVTTTTANFRNACPTVGL
ncbi:hypothetical protein DER45DRAFT_617534 [Fusarium avenaceum]|nr:hypothetical protein DER45DRAFT_617534 [Fusarium avenaceum]